MFVNAVLIVVRLQIPFSEGVAMAVIGMDSSDGDVGALACGTCDNGGASVTRGEAADEDESRPRGGKGRCCGKCRGGGRKSTPPNAKPET